MCEHMYVNIYVCVYIYIYTHTHTHRIDILITCLLGECIIIKIPLPWVGGFLRFQFQ